MVVDYLAVDQPTPKRPGRSASAWRAVQKARGRRARPARRNRQRPGPGGRLLRGRGPRLLVTGIVGRARAIRVIGLPSSGLHSNGYTWLVLGGIPMTSARPPPWRHIDRATEVYVRPIVEPLHSEVDHITLRRPRQPAPARGRGCLRRPTRCRSHRLRSHPGARRGQRRGDARRLQHGLRLLLCRRGRGCGARSIRGHYPEVKRTAGPSARNPRSDGPSRTPRAPWTVIIRSVAGVRPGAG